MLLLLLAACQDTSITKVDGYPSATILSPLDGDAFAPGDLVALRGAATDPDGDEVVARWLVDEVEVCPDAAPEADGTTRCETTVAGGNVRVQLEVRDPRGNVAVDTIALVVTDGDTGGDSGGDTGDDSGGDTGDGDLPPTASITAPLDGATLVAGETLPFSGVVSDGEDEPATLAVTWTDSLDGGRAVGPPGADGTTSGSWTPTVGAHVLTLSVTDGAAQSAEAAVAFEVVAPNEPPTQPGVSITPGAPVEGDSLLCAVTTPSVDPEGESVHHTFSWDVDGAAFGGATTTTEAGDTVPAGTALTGERWTCTVTPDDGVDVGPSGAASVTVGAASACPDGNCALRYDGVNDYVEVPASASLDGGGRALTVEAWVWYDSVTSNCMTTVRKGTASSPTYDYWLHKNMSPGDSLFWGSWSGWVTQAFSAVTAGRWYHYAGTYDPGSALSAIWLDGAQISTSATGGTPTANADPLRIGIDWDLGCATLGVIDEVRISSVVRYTAPFAPATSFSPDADTLALWHFDEYTGAVATDASGNGNNGVINGATWTTESP